MLYTGDKFYAFSKLNQEAIPYEFIGFQPYEDTGCRYIVLKRLDTEEYTEVEAAWFRERRIVKMVSEGGK